MGVEHPHPPARRQFHRDAPFLRRVVDNLVAADDAAVVVALIEVVPAELLGNRPRGVVLLAVALLAVALLQADDVGLRRLDHLRRLRERLTARFAAHPDVERHHAQRLRGVGWHTGTRIHAQQNTPAQRQFAARIRHFPCDASSRLLIRTLRYQTSLPWSCSTMWPRRFVPNFFHASNLLAATRLFQSSLPSSYSTTFSPLR